MLDLIFDKHEAESSKCSPGLKAQDAFIDHTCPGFLHRVTVVFTSGIGLESHPTLSEHDFVGAISKHIADTIVTACRAGWANLVKSGLCTIKL